MIERRWLMLAGVAAWLVLASWKENVPQAIAEAENAATSPNEAGRPSKPETRTGPGCLIIDPFFAEEVWAKVAERTCLKCHTADGEASDSQFLLQDPARHWDQQEKCLSHNRAAFERVAAAREDDQSRLLLKVTGQLDHGGGEVLKPDSTGYRILASFVRRTIGKPTNADRLPNGDDIEATPFFSGVETLSPPRLLRRVTLSLAARLPTSKERAAVQERGLEAMDAILDQVMQEEAFYDRLQEGFNDVFLTRGQIDNPEIILSYDHFNKTRLWTQKHDLSHVPEKERQKARYALTDKYREALLREPMELIKYVVQNDRPFTELVTADYVMVSPYTARGYGIYDELKDQFKDPEDPFEYVPTKLKALKSRNGKVQESATGFYPHSGLLSTFHYVRRYPTTATNRNRLRARMYYQHFLGIDIMQLAPRVTDAAAVDAQYEIPTMQAADCVVCHKVIDPVAGLFQDYNEEGYVAKRKEGWYTDMFGSGLEGEDLPEDERWRSLQWLGERTAKDPRFAVAMVEHVYYLLMGRKVLQPPEDIDDPLFGSKRRAYKEQRTMIEDIAERFANAGFNLKVVFKDLIATRFYQADGVATVAADLKRRAELDDVGVVRLLTPEQLERKLKAVFGKKWGRLDEQFLILYGGIDSESVTERMTEPSGAMGAIQRIMANDVASKNVSWDFTTEPSERLLFPEIEPTVLPGESPQADKQIRQAIVHLHQHVLGIDLPLGHPEVDRTFELFTGIISDAKTRKGLDTRESYFSRGRDDKRLDDPHYTVRAWRGVVTYLLRQHDFLYE